MRACMESLVALGPFDPCPGSAIGSAQPARHSGHVYVGCERKPFGAQDGGGAWNTLSPNNWWNGNADVGWPGGTNGAIFGAGSGTVGTVTVGPTGVSVGAVTFNAPGAGTYTIAGGPITLANSPSTFTMNANASISAVLSGNGGLTETGGNSLQLAASNTYSGPTTVSFAILRLSNSAALPSGNLTLDGGLLELAAGGFTRSVGGGPGQVQFTANGGGFSAIGANRIVNLGGSSAALDLGQQRFPAQRRGADARHDVSRFHDRFPKPARSERWHADHLGDRGQRHRKPGCAALGQPQRQRRIDREGRRHVGPHGQQHLYRTDDRLRHRSAAEQHCGIVQRQCDSRRRHTRTRGRRLRAQPGQRCRTKCNSRATAAAFQPRGPTAR